MIVDGEDWTFTGFTTDGENAVAHRVENKIQISLWFGVEGDDASRRGAGSVQVVAYDEASKSLCADVRGLFGRYTRSKP